MKIHWDKNNNYKFERENWTELFRLEVDNNCLRDNWFILPKGFIKVIDLWDKNHSIYYLWFLVPFVRLWFLIKKIWWIIPKWLYKKGYFEHKEGEAEHWFWILKIRFRKILRKVAKFSIIN